MERSLERNIILIAGAPGSGKTSLGKELARHYDTPYRHTEHVSFGDRVRRIAGEVGSLAIPSSDHTDYVRAHLAHDDLRDELLDDSVAAGIFSEILTEHRDTNLLFVDGFPRNNDQYFEFSRLISCDPEARRNFGGIIITTTENEQMALERLIRRNSRGNEPEMTDERAQRRLLSSRHDLGMMLDNFRIHYGPWCREVDTSNAKSHTKKLGIAAINYFLNNPFDNQNTPR